jgi:hypothetical protein
MSIIDAPNYAPRGMLQIVASLNDESRGAIYACNMCIVQSTPDKIRVGTGSY